MPPLIQPNWHIAVVHFPIGLIVIGTLVELFSFLGWRGSGFRRAGRWMLLIGAVTSVPTTFTGLYALSDLLPPGGLAELAQTNARLAEEMRLHVWTQSIATAAAVFLVVLWIALSDLWRDRLNLLFKLGLLGVSGLILFGAHLGGDSVYQHALAVDPKRPPSTLPAVKQLADVQTWEDLFPVLQNHVTLAGLAMAMAAVTLGIAIRMAHTGYAPTLQTDHAERIAAAFGATDALDTPAGTIETIRVSRNTTPPVWATKFWLLSALLLMGTSALGVWTIAEHGSWDFNNLWNTISQPEGDGPRVTRLLAHAVVGTVLIVDSLILAILARFAPRSTIALLVFSVPLVLAMSAQVWLGVILLFTGRGGAVTHF